MHLNNLKTDVNNSGIAELPTAPVDVDNDVVR